MEVVRGSFPLIVGIRPHPLSEGKGKKYVGLSLGG